MCGGGCRDSRFRDSRFRDSRFRDSRFPQACFVALAGSIPLFVALAGSFSALRCSGGVLSRLRCSGGVYPAFSLLGGVLPHSFVALGSVPSPSASVRPCRPVPRQRGAPTGATAIFGRGSREHFSFVCWLKYARAPVLSCPRLGLASPRLSFLFCSMYIICYITRS